MDRITRKELKTDKFAAEVTHTVEYVAEHRRQFTRYGAAGAAVLLIVGGVYFYTGYQRSTRQRLLREATRIQEAEIGPTGNPYMLTFATQEEKDKATIKAFTELATTYAGTDEGEIARYYMAAGAIDKGNLGEAEKRLQQVIEEAKEPYPSLARYSLAQLYATQGKTAEAEKLLRVIIEKPSLLVSKEQATITLGRVLAATKPAEARKLVEPLRTERSTVSKAALTALGEMPAQ